MTNKQKTRNVMSPEDYKWGTPTSLDRPLIEVPIKDSPKFNWEIREGYHLLRIDHNTYIEVKDGVDDVKTRENFIARLSERHIKFCHRLKMKLVEETKDKDSLKDNINV